jgi:GH24 family phage-related lysozyme (muramidase)
MAINKKTTAVVGATVAALVGFEGMILKSYRDIVGVLTVCIGETEKEAFSKPLYIPAQCKALLGKSLVK